MRCLQREIERAIEVNREVAGLACHVADWLPSHLTPATLQGLQHSLRADLFAVDQRLSNFRWRRSRRAQVLGRRFAGTPYFRECRNAHVAMLEERDRQYRWRRDLIRQVGDTVAWLVLRRDPAIISALFAKRSHHSPDLVGLMGPHMLSDQAHAAGMVLVIDNDLTRCLGTGDITVVSNDDLWARPIVLEIKTRLDDHGEIEISAFGPSSGDESDTRLFDLFRQATIGDDSPPYDVSVNHPKQTSDMQTHIRLLFELTRGSVESLRGPSSVQWQSLENVLSKALQTGSSFDIVDGVVYLAVRSRASDQAAPWLIALRDRLIDFGIDAPQYESHTIVEFEQHDFVSAIIPPIALWRLSHAVRAALLSGELFFATLNKPNAWVEAFAKNGITLVDEKRGWTLQRGTADLFIRRRDVVRLRLALAFIGMSPARLADNVARLLGDVSTP